MIALLVLTDGRGYLDHAITSLQMRVKGEFGLKVIVDDSQDREHARKLMDTYCQDGWALHVNSTKRGFAGTIQAGWETLLAFRDKEGFDITHVWHQEDDFTYNEEVDLEEMKMILNAEPKLAQLALIRQPWNEQEKAAGGIIQMWPDLYEETMFYLKHRVNFTTNPSMYRMDLVERGWPDAPGSEVKFSEALLRDGYYFGYWQDTKFAGPKVNHIGVYRAGCGY